MIRAILLGLLLSALGCHTKASPPTPLFGLPSGQAQPVCITDSTGLYCASIVPDAGGTGLNGIKTYGASAATGAAAPGTPAYNPSWYGYTNIYLDPVSGNDSNAGNTSGAALATCAEAIRRYGSTSPTMNYGQNITWNQLSAVPAGTDPCFFFPRLSGGGYAAYIGTLVPFYSSDGGGNYLLGTVTAASQAGGTDMTIANMPTGTTAGMYLYDSTAGSYAYVESMSGQTGTMTQPLTAASLTTIGLPSCTLGTMSTGDTATLYNIPSASGLKQFRATGADVSDAGSNQPSVTWIQWTQILDTSGLATPGSEFPSINDSASTIMSGVYIASRLHMGSLHGRGNGNDLLGSFVVGAAIVFSGDALLCGDFLKSTLALAGSAGLGTFTQIGGNTTVNSTSQISSNIEVNNSGAHFVGNITTRSATLELTAPAWGAAGVIASGIGGGVWCNGSWAANFLLTGANQLGTATTGSRYVSLGVNVDSIPLTVAAFADAGSLFNPNSGVRFTIGQ
jgi:hypothetical protein